MLNVNRSIGLYVLLFTLLSGCGEDTAIRSYTVAKTKSPPPVAAEPSPAQMLGVIVPHRESAWFFKLTDQPEKVQRLADEFRRLAGSLSFAEDGTPQWKLVEGWTERILRQITYAQFSSADGATVTLTQLGANTADPQQWHTYLTDNINRWRQQLSLSPLDWPTMQVELEEVPTHSTETAKAYFVSLTGEQTSGGGRGMRAPFLEQMGEQSAKNSPATSAPVSSAPVSSAPVSSAPVSSAPVSSAPVSSAPATISPAADNGRLKLSYQAPEGWQEQSTTGIRLASFEIPDQPTPATVYVSTAGGPIETSVGMWLQQVGAEASDEKIQQSTQSAVEGQVQQISYRCYTILGDDDAKAIRVAVIPLGDQGNLYVKMTGSKSLVQSQSKAMDQFIASLVW